MMNGTKVETVNHLTENGVRSAEAMARNEPAVHELDASKLTVTRTTTPGNVPELDSKEVWEMKTCTDHSMSLLSCSAITNFRLSKHPRSMGWPCIGCRWTPQTFDFNIAIKRGTNSTDD